MELAASRPEKLQRFIDLHHRALKALAVEDDEFFGIIIDHLPFETSLGTMTFGEYRRERNGVKFVPDVDSFPTAVASVSTQEQNASSTRAIPTTPNYSRR